jgi:hypothetical protein
MGATPKATLLEQTVNRGPRTASSTRRLPNLAPRSMDRVVEARARVARDSRATSCRIRHRIGRQVRRFRAVVAGRARQKLICRHQRPAVYRTSRSARKAIAKASGNCSARAIALAIGGLSL